jgi:diaminopimelate epimerase
MTKTIKFTKMHGTGNDYIYVNTMEYPIANPEELSRLWSAYHTGIGSDGLILIEKSDKADFSMRIFNADGSEAMMCGNGSRCVGKYVYENHLTDKKEISLETLSGIKYITLHTKENMVTSVSIDMGKPEIIAKDIKVEDLQVTGTAISMGNPHLVFYVDDINKMNLPVIGPKLEHHPMFADRTNVEFAQIISDGEVRMRVWERGSGITMACGTGACATAVAGAVIARTNKENNIVMDGGTVNVRWDESTNHVFMTGPATKVFDGTIEY